MKNFLVHNEKTKQEMCDSIGVNSVEDLFKQIPQSVRMSALELPEGLSEMETQKQVKILAKDNQSDYATFLGGGIYNKFVPACIAQVANRFEFNTAYTPYQPEISQGTLQIIYEYQTLVSRLTGMDIANASMYDGGSACAEAILMAARLTKKNKVFIDENINPNYIEVIKTYLWAQNIEYEISNGSNSDELCAKIYQTPNRYGEFMEMPSKNNKELIISIVDLVSLALYEPPKSDITVGDIQSLGIGLNFGGAYAGFIACQDKYKRQLCGRIAGKTKDKNGKVAYCLTLQAREQHIRREKATSNICSNQALVAFCANLYLRKLGKTGFLKIAQESTNNAHYLAQKLQELGFEVKNKDFFDEFCVNVGNSEKFLAFMKEKNILAGVKLNSSEILVSVSELNSIDELENYIEEAKKLSLIRI